MLETTGPLEPPAQSPRADARNWRRVPQATRPRVLTAETTPNTHPGGEFSPAVGGQFSAAVDRKSVLRDGTCVMRHNPPPLILRKIRRDNGPNSRLVECLLADREELSWKASVRE
jgi:hypothetical protein